MKNATFSLNAVALLEVNTAAQTDSKQQCRDSFAFFSPSSILRHTSGRQDNVRCAVENYPNTFN